jgi:solute carrier family 25 protein 38
MGKQGNVPSHSFAGAISASLSAILTQPFDVVKTAMIGNNQHKTISNSLTAFRSVLQTNGVIGLWKGSVPSFWRVLPGGAIYFGAINFSTTRIKAFTGKDLTKFGNFMVGASSRAVATTIVSPISLIKTRFEFYPTTASSTGVLTAMKQIFKLEGVSGLFKGLIPSILRDSSYSGFFYLFYTSSKAALYNIYPNQDVQVQMMSGSFSGVMATVITHPFDVARTRIQLQTNENLYKGAFTTLGTIYRNEGGIRMLFKGVVPRCIKRSVQSTVTWTLYEQLSRLLNK